jgi:hypothetical protein
MTTGTTIGWRRKVLRAHFSVFADDEVFESGFALRAGADQGDLVRRSRSVVLASTTRPSGTRR